MQVPFDADDLDLMRAAVMAAGWRGEDMRRAADVVDKLDGALAVMRAKADAPLVGTALPAEAPVAAPEPLGKAPEEKPPEKAQTGPRVHQGGRKRRGR